MTLPRVKQTILDGGLGLAQADASSTQVKMGVASAGPTNVLAFYTDPQALQNDYQGGPLVEAACQTLQTAGGPVGVMRIAGTVAGSVGAVTKTGTGTGTVTVAGASVDNYDAIIQLTRDGANIAAGTAAFIYSLDGGDTFSPETAVPTSGVYAVPGSGITATFVNGGSGTSFVTGDKHAFSGVAPGYSSSDLVAALTALRADPSQWAWVHIIGVAGSVSAAATLAVAVDAQMAAAETGYRYCFAILECPDDTDTNIKTAFANFISSRVGIAAGFCELTSAVSGRTYKRPSAWAATTRMAQQDIRRDLARVRDDGEGGALEGVTKLYRDEYVTEALDTARFITLRTYPGKPGFFVTNGRLMAAPTSDYQFVQFRRIMDVACAINYLAMLDYLNGDELRVQDVTGFINEVDARAIEATVGGKLTSELTDKERVSSASAVIRRDVNILSTQTLVENVRIVPKGYAKYINATISFFNPALQPKAA